MRPYKPFYEAWNDYLPPVSQIARKDDISKWSDEKALQEIQRLKSFISRIRTTGDDQSVQDEVRQSYDAINRIERIKFPDKFAKKQASKDKSRNKAFDKRETERKSKFQTELEEFKSSSDEEQANFILYWIQSAIRSSQDSLNRSRKSGGDLNFRKSLVKEIDKKIEFRNRLKEMFPGLSGRNEFRALSRELLLTELKDKLNSKKLKDLLVDYLKETKRDTF